MLKKKPPTLILVKITPMVLISTFKFLLYSNLYKIKAEHNSMSNNCMITNEPM